MVVTNGDDEQSGSVAYAYATRFRDRPAYRYVVETSIYVAGPVQGQGTGRLLYRALIDTLRAQGFTQAISAIALPNDHSIALHEATGFRRAGEIGRASCRKECVSTCRSRWSPYHSKKKIYIFNQII